MSSSNWMDAVPYAAVDARRSKVRFMAKVSSLVKSCKKTRCDVVDNGDGELAMVGEINERAVVVRKKPEGSLAVPRNSPERDASPGPSDLFEGVQRVVGWDEGGRSRGIRTRHSYHVSYSQEHVCGG